MRAEATRRTEAAGSPAELVDGDALALPFDDGSVGCLRCERVWQHLTDPLGAAREVARVLAPGGRAVIVDSDWETSIVSPGDPDVLRRYAESSLGRMANPLSGRHLRHQLRSVGLEVDPDIGSAAVVLPEELLRRPFVLTSNVEAACREGKLTEQEARDLVDGFVAAVEEGAAFVSVTMFAVLGRKPA
jgi:SAM-dependent methyltransferase